MFLHEGKSSPQHARSCHRLRPGEGRYGGRNLRLKLVVTRRKPSFSSNKIISAVQNFFVFRLGGLDLSLEKKRSAIWIRLGEPSSSTS
jgi:hypothetical protein